MRSIPPYFFAQLGRRIAELKSRGHDVIRMDMGSPDLPPDPYIIQSLTASAQEPSHHAYTPFGGTDELKAAIREYYRSRFNVDLDLDDEILCLIGSKEGLFNITQAHVDPGDVVLVPDPGYPIYSTAASFAGGEVVLMPLRAENEFLPDLDLLDSAVLDRVKMMWLNYPNNPTGATAELDFFGRVVELARRHSFLVCHDAPYTEVCFDGYVAPSILQVEGARDVAVEFNSLSKSHNMAGWRVGMAVGHAGALRALYTLKSQVDTSHFRAVLDAAATALRGDQSWLVKRNAVYRHRRDLVCEALRNMGIDAPVPRASLYIWATLPASVTSSVDFCSRMLDEIHVSVTPGVAFGEAGEGYIRISLGSPTERVQEAMERLKGWTYA
jgi:LL-diaminopimelate aminotransferase